MEQNYPDVIWLSEVYLDKTAYGATGFECVL